MRGSMGPSVSIQMGKLSPRALDAVRSKHGLSKMSVGADGSGVNTINVLKLKPSS